MPALAPMPAVTSSSFASERYVAGLVLSLTSETLDLSRSLTTLLDQGFQWDSSPPAQAAASSSLSRLRLDFRTRTSPLLDVVPSSNGSVMPVRLACSGNRILLEFGYASVQLDILAHRAVIDLADEFWRLSLKLQQEVVILSLLWLMQAHGRLALHATAVSGPRGLILLAGASGSGKSTTAMSLISSGWSFLADDIVVFQSHASNFHFWGLPRGFAFSHQMLARIPALAAMDESLLWDLGDKMFGLIEAVFPRRLSSSTRVAGLVFPTVQSESPSRLERLSPIEAVARLIDVSGGILTSPTQGQRQLDAIAQLAQHAPAFRLLAGPDVYCNGAVINDLLRAQGIA